MTKLTGKNIQIGKVVVILAGKVMFLFCAKTVNIGENIV